MLIFSRELALTSYAIYKISSLSKNEIDNILCSDYLDEEGETKEYDSAYSPNVQNFLVGHFTTIILVGISNNFLKKFLEDCFKDDVNIIGDEEVLYKCPCCGYLTLSTRGEYEVCRVCMWEDDGGTENDIERISTVNHSSIKDYRDKHRTLLEPENIPYKKGD
ncbi:CPCC family cysteine-rich protein [Lysinibacillus sp. JNUCC-51]|uniref:CPCC family cysteine-rich protein n=1 Tax=Lysinibacillus sp. JNUCC-51 TaxID=2792479 RepID=UPI0019352CC8|nr:hypothetical protein JNUCC51_20455 [Lysinibacillus sp. JNUCC-51]